MPEVVQVTLVVLAVPDLVQVPLVSAVPDVVVQFPLVSAESGQQLLRVGQLP